MEKSVDYAAQNLAMGLLLVKLTKNAGRLQGSFGSFEDEVVLKTVEYIESSFKDAKLGVLAEKLGVSPVSLSKIIKKRLNLTFKGLLLDKRLSFAEKLIRNTTIPITEIIYFVGYENTNFFYKMFSKRYEVSPKEYRRIFSQKDKQYFAMQ